MYSFRDQLQPVLTSFLWFFAVPVRGSCILKLSGTGPVRGPSKKGNRTETGPDFKALSLGGNSPSPRQASYDDALPHNQRHARVMHLKAPSTDSMPFVSSSSGVLDPSIDTDPGRKKGLLKGILRR